MIQTDSDYEPPLNKGKLSNEVKGIKNQINIRNTKWRKIKLVLMLSTCASSAAEELNPICPASDVTPLVQMSVSHDVGNAVSRETLSPANNRSIDGNLPSSFTAFLNDSCTEPQEGKSIIRRIDVAFNLPLRYLVLTR